MKNKIETLMEKIRDLEIVELMEELVVKKILLSHCNRIADLDIALM